MNSRALSAVAFITSIYLIHVEVFLKNVKHSQSEYSTRVILLVSTNSDYVMAIYNSRTN